MTEPTPLAPSTAEAVAATERLAVWVIGALTAIVIGGVALVIVAPHGGHAGGSSWLPEINASLNGTAAILLSTGYVLIRRRRIAAHRACMIAAFAASSLFLITYLIHHARVGSVPFHGAAWLRPVYFGLLIPHNLAVGVGGAGGADDHPPCLVWPLRPSPAAGASDAAHLAVRLGQRRPRVRPPLPLRSLSPPTLLVIGLSCISRRQGGLDAETTKRRDRNPGPRSAGSEFRDPVVAGKCLKQQAEGEERSAPSSQGTRKVAPWWSRPSAKICCREDGAEEDSGDAPSPEGEDRSPSSQASAWSWPSTWVEEEGGIDGEGRRTCRSVGERLVRLVRVEDLPHPPRPPRPALTKSRGLQLSAAQTPSHAAVSSGHAPSQAAG